MSRKPPKSAWKKGQSGNPKGRPPISSLKKESLNKFLEAGISEIDGIITSVINQAKQGNIQAAKLMLDHLLPSPDSNFEEDIMDNLTDEDNAKIYDFIATILPEDQILWFVDATKKVTAFVKEIKAQRLH